MDLNAVSKNSLLGKKIGFPLIKTLNCEKNMNSLRKEQLSNKNLKTYIFNIQVKSSFEDIVYQQLNITVIRFSPHLIKKIKIHHFS